MKLDPETEAYNAIIEALNQVDEKLLCDREEHNRLLSAANSIHNLGKHGKYQIKGL